MAFDDMFCKHTGSNEAFPYCEDSFFTGALADLSQNK